MFLWHGPRVVVVLSLCVFAKILLIFTKTWVSCDKVLITTPKLRRQNVTVRLQSSRLLNSIFQGLGGSRSFLTEKRCTDVDMARNWKKEAQHVVSKVNTMSDLIFILLRRWLLFRNKKLYHHHQCFKELLQGCSWMHPTLCLSLNNFYRLWTVLSPHAFWLLSSEFPNFNEITLRVVLGLYKDRHHCGQRWNTSRSPDDLKYLNRVMIVMCTYNSPFILSFQNGLQTLIKPIYLWSVNIVICNR